MADQPNIQLSDLSPKKILTGIVGLALALAIFSSFYTVGADENGVVLRFGKFHDTTSPGLHFKLPLGIDKVYNVKTGKQYKLEFGFRNNTPVEEEAWMLTGDLNIANVWWVVQFKIDDPRAYLFNVRDVENTIRDVSEAIMSLMIGDRSFEEAKQTERTNINNLVKEHMQALMDKYETGISIRIVQLQNVLPPDRVAESFNEVNRAKQEQKSAINKALQAYEKEIGRVEGDAERLVAEAEGYAIERVNNAKGDVAAFDAVVKEYRKAPQITRDRLYLETMQRIYSRASNKVVVDKRLKNVLPLLNLNNNTK